MGIIEYTPRVNERPRRLSWLTATVGRGRFVFLGPPHGVLMPTQRSVATRFWTSNTLRGVSPIARLLMLYCLTCPRSTLIGFFRFSLDDCMDETGLSKRQIEAAMVEAEKAEFLEWDRHTHYVWVCKRVSYEFPNGKLSDKQLEAVRRILEDAPVSSIKFRLCERYKGYGIPFMDGYGNGTDPASVSVSASATTSTSSSGGSDRPTPESPDDLMTVWNELASQTARNGWKGMVPCRDLSKSRREKAVVRLNESELAWHRQAITKLAASDFACGKPTKDREGNLRSWRASFDWYIENDTNCLKAMEGKYDNTPTR